MKNFWLTPVPTFKHSFFLPWTILLKDVSCEQGQQNPSLLQGPHSTSGRYTAPLSLVQPGNETTDNDREVKHPDFRLGNKEDKQNEFIVENVC